LKSMVVRSRKEGAHIKTVIHTGEKDRTRAMNGTLVFNPDEHDVFIEALHFGVAWVHDLEIRFDVKIEEDTDVDRPH